MQTKGGGDKLQYDPFGPLLAQVVIMVQALAPWQTILGKQRCSIQAIMLAVAFLDKKNPRIATRASWFITPDLAEANGDGSKTEEARTKT